MSQQIPQNLKYTKEHEWLFLDGDIASIGITDFAQNSLGDIVFVELPEAESELEENSTFGVVESIKSVSDLFSPVSGTITEVNEALSDDPELCNQAPYESWIIKIKVSDKSQIENLMDAQQYDKYCQEQS